MSYLKPAKQRRKPVVNLVKEVERELRELSQILPEVNRLPQSVNDVCDVFTRQFMNTAHELVDRADALEKRAKELRVMADRIADASNNVPKALKDWVKTEIQYRDAALKVSMVNPEDTF